jgi:hypothetical protein
MPANNIKTRRVLLASGARTASTASIKQTDVVCKILRLYLSVTAASGTGGLQPQVRAYDIVSGNSVALTTGGTAITATGTYCYEMGLAEGTAANNVKECVLRPVPYQWDVNVVHGDGSSYTYSLSAEVIP